HRRGAVAGRRHAVVPPQGAHHGGPDPGRVAGAAHPLSRRFRCDDRAYRVPDPQLLRRRPGSLPPWLRALPDERHERREDLAVLVALGIFIATLVLVIWQPRGLGVGWSALFGAGLALLTGVVGLADIPTVWGFVWNATFTFVAVIIISLVLDEAGFFEWAALHVARWGKDSGR